jgi:hypothetical protein
MDSIGLMFYSVLESGGIRGPIALYNSTAPDVLSLAIDLDFYAQNQPRV